MPVTVFANHKGGVGKTTMLAALAAALASRTVTDRATGQERPRRVLCNDLDPQGNLSRRMGYTEEELSSRPTMAEAVRDASPDTLRATLLPCQWEPAYAENITLAPSRIELEERVSEAGVPGSWRRLAKALRPLTDEYDDILIDTPPTLGHMLHLALASADDAIGVASPETDAMRGVIRLDTFINDPENREALGLKCDLSGVVINLSRTGVVDKQEQVDRAHARWGERVWEVIPMREPISSANERAMPPQLAASSEVRGIITDAANAMADRYLARHGEMAAA